MDRKTAEIIISEFLKKQGGKLENWDKDEFEQARGFLEGSDYERKRAEKLVDALNEIKKGEGRYSMDHLQHEANTIEDMKELAEKALSLYKTENDNH